MSYSGSTASSPNPPRCIVPAMGGPLAADSTSVANGSQLWFYSSTNLTTDMMASNFFTDAKYLGMRNGDVLIAPTYSTQSATGHILVIGMITGVSTSGANLSTGGAMTSTFG